LTERKFEWQQGFGVFSYSKSQIENVYKYLLNQEEQHKKDVIKKRILSFWKNLKLSMMKGLLEIASSDTKVGSLLDYYG
jgi:putative transposase